MNCLGPLVGLSKPYRCSQDVSQSEKSTVKKPKRPYCADSASEDASIHNISSRQPQVSQMSFVPYEESPRLFTFMNSSGAKDVHSHLLRSNRAHMQNENQIQEQLLPLSDREHIRSDEKQIVEMIQSSRKNRELFLNQLQNIDFDWRDSSHLHSKQRRSSKNSQPNRKSSKTIKFKAKKENRTSSSTLANKSCRQLAIANPLNNQISKPSTPRVCESARSFSWRKPKDERAFFKDSQKEKNSRLVPKQSLNQKTQKTARYQTQKAYLKKSQVTLSVGAFKDVNYLKQRKSSFKHSKTKCPNGKENSPFCSKFKDSNQNVKENTEKEVQNVKKSSKRSKSKSSSKCQVGYCHPITDRKRKQLKDRLLSIEPNTCFKKNKAKKKRCF